jgi:hypothetical protein
VGVGLLPFGTARGVRSVGRIGQWVLRPFGSVTFRAAGATSLIAAFRGLAASWGGLRSDPRNLLERSSWGASALLSLCSRSAALQGDAQHSFHSRSRERASSRVSLKPLTRTHAAEKVRSCPRWPETVGGNPGQVGGNTALAAGGRVIAAGQAAGSHGQPGSWLCWREMHGVPAQEPSGKVDGM